jgi:murein DD-endopeptidase MepM/ murein hydrolase activator NlpD
MGRYQFLPSTAKMFVDFTTKEEFLSNPAKQDAAFDGYIQYLIEKSGDVQGCELAKAIAAGWYSGDPSLRNSTRTQTNNGNSYPSIASYADSVAAKTNCEQWGVGGSSAKVFPVPGQTYDDLFSPYGPRTPFKTDNGRMTGSFHHGDDFACAFGQPLVATESGRVKYFDDDPHGLGAHTVTLYPESMPDAKIFYGHAQKRLVPDGSTVTAGQPIAECGSEGSSTGPHLHFQLMINDGQGYQSKNPSEYLRGIEP